MMPVKRLLLCCVLTLVPLVMSSLAAADTTSAPQRDVVLVLDNSGSMRDNDPQSLAPAAVRQFIESLTNTDRVALLMFAGEVTAIQDFVTISDGRQQLLDGLAALDYSGQHTDSPAAIERAIYALKNNAREDASRVIIFMTDGIVDTGNSEQDSARAAWLRNDLATDAARSDIRIFAIAFTNDADFQLIQSLANTTGGDYFRALTAADLGAVFTRINAAINATNSSDEAGQAVETPSAVAAPEPIIVEVPVPFEMPAAGPDYTALERQRLLILIIAAVVVCLTLLAILVVLIRRGRTDQRPPEDASAQAFLHDPGGRSGQATHELGRKPTMLGRTAGTDRQRLQYIVIPENTIGRRHALIEYKDYAFWIVDQSSINGTYVNDKLVTSEMRLKHGDRIRLHKYELEFSLSDMDDDAGMTVVSNTQYAAAGGAAAGATTVSKASATDSGHAVPPPFNENELFDISGGQDVDQEADNDDSTPSEGHITLSEDGYEDAADATLHTPARPAEDEDTDVTLTPGMDGDADATLSHLFNAESAADDADECARDDWIDDEADEDRDASADRYKRGR